MSNLEAGVINIADNRCIAAGDRSHIPASARPIFDILTPEMARIKSKAPSTYAPQVNDTERRLNILFDHLNNEDLLGPDTVGSMVSISDAIGAKNWDQAQRLFSDMQATKEKTEGGNWIVSLRVLPAMCRSLLTQCLVGRQALDCYGQGYRQDAVGSEIIFLRSFAERCMHLYGSTNRRQYNVAKHDGPKSEIAGFHWAISE